MSERDVDPHPITRFLPFTPEPEPAWPEGVSPHLLVHPAAYAARRWWAEAMVSPGRCVPSRVHWHETAPVMFAVCEKCGQVLTSERTRYCD